MRGTFKAGLATSVAALAMLGLSALPASATLHGYCAGAGQCADNGFNSPTSTNPPVNFGFTVSPGGATGDFSIDVLIPNNEDASPSTLHFSLTGTLTGTANLFSPTAWSSGNLGVFLGTPASPDNPIGAFLDTQLLALDPGATGFFVYHVNLGTTTLHGTSNPDVSPLENISPNLALGSYIVGFLNEDGDIEATANSGAILETGTPHTSIPEPASLALFGVGLLGLGLVARRRA